MAEHYLIAYNGQLAEGKALAAVKQGVAQLFKVDAAKVEHLFSGQWVAIKKGLDEATAKKYQGALARMGAICRVVTETEFSELKAVPPSATSKQVVSKGGAAATDATVAMPPHSVVKEAPAGLGALEGVAVESNWDHLEEHQDIPPPQVDLSGVTLAEPGTRLVEHEAIPEPQVNTSELSLDDLGVDMAAHEEVPELEVDISQMALDEPGVILVEPKPVEAPDIDISKISLE